MHDGNIGWQAAKPGLSRTASPRGVARSGPKTIWRSGLLAHALVGVTRPDRLGRPLLALGISALCFFMVSVANGQALYSLTSAPGNPLVRIDVDTGVVQTVLVTNLPTLHPGFVAFDDVGGRLFLLSGFVGTQLLHIIDVRNGALTSQPIPHSDAYFNFFEYDPGTSKLYTLTFAAGTPLVSIDPSTGVVQTVLVTNLPTLHPGFVAFDDEGGRLFLLSGFVGTQLLHIIDVRNGALTSQPIPHSDAYFNFIEYDPGTSKLYTLTSAAGTPLVSIDPSTGVVQTVLVTNLPTLHPAFVTFDDEGGRLFLLSGFVGTQLLHIIDVRNGALTSRPIPHLDFYFFFEYDGAPVSAVEIPTLSLQSLGALAVLLAFAGVLLLGPRS